MPIDDDGDDDETAFENVFGPVVEKIKRQAYEPDKFLMDKWNRMFRAPYPTWKDGDQGVRINEIHKHVILLGSHMLKFCPNSFELDTALAKLHEARHWAVTAIQANE